MVFDMLGIDLSHFSRFSTCRSVVVFFSTNKICGNNLNVVAVIFMTTTHG